MGNYNPHAPQILGQEWVPIRDVGLVYSPNVNALEVGTIYTQPSAQRVRDARFYLNKAQATVQSRQVGLVNIYPAGLEDQTGPIRQVIIPVRSTGVTGTAITFNGAANGPEAVMQPGDGKYIEYGYAGGLIGDERVQFFFAVNDYPVLANKRILNVSLLYAGSVFDKNANGDNIDYINPDPGIPTTVLTLMNAAGIFFGYSSPTSNSTNTGALGELSTRVENASNSPLAQQVIGVVDLGDINNWWDASQIPSNTNDRMPWRYVDLQRFEASSATRHAVNLRVQLQTSAGSPGTPFLWLDYMALRVIYCEEKRIAYGARQFGYSYGMNSITMRDPSFNTDPVLPAGQYLPTLSWVSPGQVGFGQGLNGDFPKLNAVEELYQIPSHPGVKVNVPFPLEDRIGSVFSSEVTHILPQLTLHASGGTLTDPHVYGRQAAAQVYGANTATQEIYDDVVGVNTVYQQVRFYARRFGDTSVPLTLTGANTLSASTVSITPADFDQLAEILDGWREITLRFATPPTMGTLATPAPSWIWSAVGETSGNRWEVLAASAPAISGIPGNLYNLVPSPNQLYSGTYQPPGGSQAELNWIPQGVASPWVTGGGDDDATDAVLIFSQDPPTVTGVTLTARTQIVTGIGLDCGTLPCCIPSGISYQQVTWGLPPNTGAGFDYFNRVSASGWGTASNGVAWQNTGAENTVDGSSGLITVASGGDREAWIAVGGPDQDITVTLSISLVPATFRERAGVLGRLTDSSNHYNAELWQQSTGTVDLFIRKRVAGTQTDIASITTTMLASPTAQRKIRFQVIGSTLRAKAWGIGEEEPSDWMLTTTDTALTTGNNAGIFVRNDATGSPSTVFTFDNFLVSPPNVALSALELQRYDTITQTFETIMLSDDLTLVSFNDFEARVGITSVYRMRSLNALNFAGQWSALVSGAPPTPGVTGGCSNMTGALIFTSNADQSGHSNAAYAMVWDNDPIEDFKLAEADMVTFQPMYGRDGSIAFHGTERGLEAFDRTLLLQSAAIDPTRLADARTIRDLAWNSLPYVCVRDDIGDRWFANVRIPAVNARLNRTKYMARVEITETTSTPYPVNP